MHVEYLGKGIFLIFEPKFFLPLDVVCQKIGVGFRVVDDLILVIVAGPGLLLDLAREPIVPRFEAVVRGRGVADVLTVFNSLQG
jgi:hypothetical protein